MNKRFLIIGDSAIAHSIIQVMNMLTSLQFEYVGSAALEKLQELHGSDDIKGIILTPPEEIELAKHIRLTESFGNLRLLPVMILSPRSLEQHLRERRDNIFLLSPEVYLISVSGCIPELLYTMETVRPFESLEKMHVALKPYVVWSEEDDIVSSHDNFNRYGPFKLMKEYFGALPDALTNSYADMTSRLWVKKYIFLEENPIVPSMSPESDETFFRKATANKRILYIDDEHRLGWSFVLYSLFTGNSDQNRYQIFQDSATFLSTPDKRFACIDNVQGALKVIETYQESLAGALKEYSEAEHIRNRLAAQAFEDRKTSKELEARCRNSETNFSRSETSLRETEARLQDTNNRLKKASEDLLEAYTKRTGAVEIPDVLPQIKEVSEIHARFAQEGSAFNKYQEEYKRNKEIFEKHKNELEIQKPLFEETERKNNAVIKKYDEAVRALSRGRLFPYDLVILDLRLERLPDKDRAPGEISGVQVLKKIKEIDPSVPVLMFTASEKVMNYQQATDLGASGYWIKAVNSLSALKTEIIQSLEKAQEARNLWLSIRQLEAKKQLTYIRESQNLQELEKGTLSDNKKAEIIQLMKESFLLFMKELSPYEQSVYNYNHYGKIVLNMGMIQEERFSRIQDKRWDFWVTRKAKEIDPDEILIRKLRNRAAHNGGAGITSQDALWAFQKTVEKCLSR